VVPFDALAAPDPSGFVRNWKAVTGGKAIVISTLFPAPEIVHSFGMLPVPAGSAGEFRSFGDIADGWIVPEPFPDLPFPAGKPLFPIPSVWPADVEDALDLLEAIAEWAGAVSGRVYSEGALRKSLAIYRTQDLPESEGEIDPLLQIARRTVRFPPKR
jgi:hypothetical protein